MGLSKMCWDIKLMHQPFLEKNNKKVEVWKSFYIPKKKPQDNGCIILLQKEAPNSVSQQTNKSCCLDSAQNTTFIQRL